MTDGIRVREEVPTDKSSVTMSAEKGICVCERWKRPCAEIT